ncbi:MULTISPECIES: tetratricopeptide repeat protein [Flavobacteriaceae]|uniref:Tetratricopeptide repeat protein n=2 Tax=Flavobacteriaceae TaxID=49546 RepID=A0A4Y8AT20_9FLAO|nr:MULTISPECIES: tetratricopeptide repeat protein [Flavobacteriaceae]TEW73806.1 tetratricopeptide repeat protein [Gramella jeungdoensis]
MKNRFVLIFLCFTSLVFSQQKNSEQLEREAREDVREGNKLYNQLKFDEAEVAYKKALSKNPNYPKASYNLGNAIYQQNRNKEAVAQFELVEKTATDKISKAETYHNMGNAFMNEKQYDKAVAAYKNSMRNNSKDDETRYNLALAQELLKDQQNKDNQDNKDNKDNKDNQDNKDDKNKDKEGGGDEKKDDNKDQKDKGEDKEDDKGDPKNNDEKKDEEKKQDQKPRQNQLSPEQMKQLLEAMNNEENKTQKKLNAEKAKGKKVKQEKDW